MRNFSRFSLGLVVLLTLAACGGGGSDGGSNPPPPPPPPPALAPFFAPTGIPPGGTTSFPLSVGETTEGRVVAGGFADYPDDGTPLNMRPICAEFGADGTAAGLATLTDGAGSQEGICFTVSPAGNFLAGTVRTPNANPLTTDAEAVTWATDGTPSLEGSADTNGGFSAAHRGSNHAGDRVGSDGGASAILRRSGSSGYDVLPWPADGDGGVTAFDVSDGLIVVGAGSRLYSSHATVWLTPQTVAWLPEPVDAAGSIAFSISDNGAFIGGVWSDFEGANNACRWVWNPATEEYDFEPLGVNGAVMFVSNGGVCFGGAYVFGEFSRSEAGSDSAWIWDSVNGATPLREVLSGLGFDLSHFTSIDIVNGGVDAGDHLVITGDGVNSGGAREGFVARIPNNP